MALPETKIEPFALERYFARHEFTARHLLSCSDCEPLAMGALLDMAAADSRKLWEALTLGYTESRGHPLLRKEIAGQYDGISPDDVLTVVPEEGIFLFMNAVLSAGDHVVCMFPGYQSLYGIARAMGCAVSLWEPAERDDGWHFDVETLNTLLRPDTRLLVVNFPHNPTGFLPDAAEFEAVVHMARSRSIYLLSDEMYRHLEREDGATLPAACEVYENAFTLSGLSKSYGLPGLRTGWIASHQRSVLERIATLKDYTTICAGAPSEILAIIALENRHRIIAGQMARLRRNLAELERFMADFRHCFQWRPPGGGSVCLPRLTLARGAGAFCEDLVETAGMMLVPASLFDYGDRHVRIGFGREDLPANLGRLADYLTAENPIG